jgi:hypothetical protein
MPPTSAKKLFVYTLLRAKGDILHNSSRLLFQYELKAVWFYADHEAFVRSPLLP